MGESAAGWRPIQTLSKSFDVIVVDLPGFGDAPALPRGVVPTAAALADAIERQLDELGLSTVHIAGYSLGARVSLELASRGRARSVVAIAPDGLGTPAERVYEMMTLLGRRFLANVLAPVAKEVTSTGAGRAAFFGSDRSRPWQLTPADAHELLLSYAHSPAYIETVLTAMYDDLTRGLSNIRYPVLICMRMATVISIQSPTDGALHDPVGGRNVFTVSLIVSDFHQPRNRAGELLLVGVVGARLPVAEDVVVLGDLGAGRLRLLDRLLPVGLVGVAQLLQLTLRSLMIRRGSPG